MCQCWPYWRVDVPELHHLLSIALNQTVKAKFSFDMHASHAPPFEKCSFHAIATQNGRIFLKEAERSKPVVIDSHEDLTDFERTLRH